MPFKSIVSLSSNLHCGRIKNAVKSNDIVMSLSSLKTKRIVLTIYMGKSIRDHMNLKLGDRIAVLFNQLFFAFTRSVNGYIIRPLKNNTANDIGVFAFTYYTVYPIYDLKHGQLAKLAIVATSDDKQMIVVRHENFRHPYTPKEVLAMPFKSILGISKCHGHANAETIKKSVFITIHRNKSNRQQLCVTIGNDVLDEHGLLPGDRVDILFDDDHREMMIKKDINGYTLSKDSRFAVSARATWRDGMPYFSERTHCKLIGEKFHGGIIRFYY